MSKLKLKIFLILLLLICRIDSSSRCVPEEPCSLCLFHPRDCLGIFKVIYNTANIIFKF